MNSIQQIYAQLPTGTQHIEPAQIQHGTEYAKLDAIEAKMLVDLVESVRHRMASFLETADFVYSNWPRSHIIRLIARPTSCKRNLLPVCIRFQ